MLVRETSGRSRSGRIKLAERLRLVRDEERGVAILMVITTITVGLAVGGVAAVTASNAMRGSTRDENSKDAFAAADAGSQLALLRQNQVAVTADLPCIVSSASTLVAGPVPLGQEWCPPVSGDVGDASYTYRVRPPAVTSLLSQVEVVSTGTSNGVTRRVHTTAESPRADAIFAESTVKSENDIVLNSNAGIYGNSSTNGNIALSSNAEVCGSTQYGGALIPSTYDGEDCPATRPFSGGPGSVTLPSIDQGNVANDNDNHRINPDNPVLDTISGNRGDVDWDPTARTLTINGNSKLTLGGEKPYSFCRLVLNSNSWLIVAAGATVRIFFDAPENCQPQLGSGPQILLESNSRLVTTSGSPGDLQLLVVGSDDPNVTSDDVHLNSNSNTTFPITLYAPQSAIEMNSNATLLGAVAGESVHLSSNADIVSHADTAGLELPLPLSYKQTQFVECTSTDAPVSAPSSNC